MKARWFRLVSWAGLICVVMSVACTPTGSTSQTTDGTRCAIDTHAHLDAIYASTEAAGGIASDFETAAATALAMMDNLSIQKTLLMSPPLSPENVNSPVTYDYASLATVVASNPDRFGFLGGGALLNPMIHSIAAAEVTDANKQTFEDRADTIIAAGAAGFGEMAALHMSFFESHPFMEVSPDHPLFLLLADVAARSGLPIDLHMEAVATDDTSVQDGFGDPNPETLDENITAFETLLAHSRDARIIWVHVGWDNTGDMTVELLRSLLESHSNLYMSVKILESAGLQFAENRPVDESGVIRSEWVTLISDYDDRFLVGADEFYGIAGVTPGRPPSTETTWQFLDQLPEDLVTKITCENPLQVYRFE